MNSICHRITVETTPESLYRALSTEEGLSAWWTECRSDSVVGGTANFVFGVSAEHKVEMTILALEKDTKVEWRCSEGPWKGMGLFRFDVEPDERGAVLSFTHDGWPELDGFYRHCNSKWGYFFTVSLKNYLELGKGSPHPEDPRI